MKCYTFLVKIFIFLYFFLSGVHAFEIIRDTELEQFTYDIVSIDTNKISGINSIIIKISQNRS